jgi:hypothetical protein
VPNDRDGAGAAVGRPSAAAQESAATTAATEDDEPAFFVEWQLATGRSENDR